VKLPFPPKQVEAAVLLLFFVVALAAPLVDQLTHPASTFDDVEKRKLARFPKVPKKWKRLDSWDKFPGEFEKYFNDHFGLRGPLLAANARVNQFIFRRSPSPKVMQGREGWLFWNDQDALANYRGLYRLSETELENWMAVLQARREWLAARGIPYLFVVCPDKQSIYPEYLPSGVKKLRPGTALDQFIAYAASHGGIPVLDLRSDLLAAKPQGQLYLKRDTHWSEQGAFIGYQAVMARLHAVRPELVAMPFPGLTAPRPQPVGGDLSRVYRDSRTKEVITQVEWSFLPEPIALPHFPDGHRPKGERELVSIQPEKPLTPLRALVLRDSFFIRMMPYVTQHFRETTCVWPQQRLSPADERNLAALVEQTKPDIFVEEVVERLLSRRPPEARDVFGGRSPMIPGDEAGSSSPSSAAPARLP
jgi:hypothetical protein